MSSIPQFPVTSEANYRNTLIALLQEIGSGSSGGYPSGASIPEFPVTSTSNFWNTSVYWMAKIAAGGGGGGGTGSIYQFANSSLFPATGVTTALYIAKDTKFEYYWNGSAYIQVSGGNPFDQSLNTTDSATFYGLTATTASFALNKASVDSNGTIYAASGSISYGGLGYSFAKNTNVGFATDGDNFSFYTGSTLALNIADSIKQVRVPADYIFSFSSWTNNNNVADTFFGRAYAGGLYTPGNFIVGSAVDDGSSLALQAPSASFAGGNATIDANGNINNSTSIGVNGNSDLGNPQSTQIVNGNLYIYVSGTPVAYVGYSDAYQSITIGTTGSDSAISVDQSGNMTLESSGGFWTFDAYGNLTTGQGWGVDSNGVLSIGNPVATEVIVCDSTIQMSVGGSTYKIPAKFIS
jgi:hypothetical protein